MQHSFCLTLEMTKILYVINKAVVGNSKGLIIVAVVCQMYIFSLPHV